MIWGRTLYEATGLIWGRTLYEATGSSYEKNVDTHGHCYQGEGGWKFELEGIKLDKEAAFFVIESALRSMGIRSFKDLRKEK